MQTVIVPEMTSKCHSRSSAMSSFVSHLNFLSETATVGQTYFQTKIAEMTLKVDEGHWQWRSARGHISLSVSGL